MITIKKNKLNLVFGSTDSAKTTLIINEVTNEYLSDDSNEILFFTPDTEAHHIEKKFHCLINDVDMSSVKHDRKTLKPIDLVLPKGLQVIDNCRDFDSIRQNLREFSLGGKPSLVVIDNINQINFGIKLPYKEKISKMFEILSELAQNDKLTILASFYMLKSANWEENDSFTKNDEDLGGLVLIQREDKIVNIFDENSGNSYNLKINNKNLKLENRNLPAPIMN